MRNKSTHENEARINEENNRPYDGNDAIDFCEVKKSVKR